MAGIDDVLAALQSHGLILLQDKTLPSVVSLVAGEAVSGSWWSHRASHGIFACVQQLKHRPDVTATHLVDKKITFIHRKLWPALLAVAEGREKWQTRGLSDECRALLQRVEQEGSLHATGPAARHLQERLLVHGEEEHTEKGSHGQVLRTWAEWRKTRALPAGTGMKAFEGQLHLETALKKIGGDPGLLAWSRVRRG